MAENKGDEVLCTKKGWDQRAVMKTDYTRRAASTPEVVWDCLGPDAAWRQTGISSVRAERAVADESLALISYNNE